MNRVTKLICRLLGHRFDWSAKIDRDGFVCPRCNCRIRSITGREFKLEVKP